MWCTLTDMDIALETTAKANLTKTRRRIKRGCLQNRTEDRWMAWVTVSHTNRKKCADLIYCEVEILIRLLIFTMYRQVDPSVQKTEQHRSRFLQQDTFRSDRFPLDKEWQQCQINSWEQLLRGYAIWQPLKSARVWGRHATWGRNWEGNYSHSLHLLSEDIKGNWNLLESINDIWGLFWR